MNKIEINVTQEDINNNGKECLTCPISRAMTRAFGERIFVGIDHWWFEDKSSELGKELPTVAIQAIDRYIYSGRMEPFSFEVTP